MKRAILILFFFLCVTGARADCTKYGMTPANGLPDGQFQGTPSYVSVKLRHAVYYNGNDAGTYAWGIYAPFKALKPGPSGFSLYATCKSAFSTNAPGAWSPAPGCGELWSDWGCGLLGPIQDSERDNPTVFVEWPVFVYDDNNGVAPYWLKKNGVPYGYEDYLRTQDAFTAGAWMNANPMGSGGGSGGSGGALPGDTGTPLYNLMNSILTQLQTNGGSGGGGGGGSYPSASDIGTAVANSLIGGGSGGGGAGSLTSIGNGITALPTSIASAISPKMDESIAATDAVRQQLILLPNNIANAMGTKLQALFVPDQEHVDELFARSSDLKDMPPFSYVNQIKTAIDTSEPTEQQLDWSFTLAGKEITVGVSPIVPWFAPYRAILGYAFWLGFALWLLREFTPKQVVG
jgi:hypothetical protein